MWSFCIYCVWLSVYVPFSSFFCSNPSLNISLITWIHFSVRLIWLAAVLFIIMALGSDEIAAEARALRLYIFINIDIIIVDEKKAR